MTQTKKQREKKDIQLEYCKKRLREIYPKADKYWIETMAYMILATACLEEYYTIEGKLKKRGGTKTRLK